MFCLSLGLTRLLLFSQRVSCYVEVLEKTPNFNKINSSVDASYAFENPPFSITQIVLVKTKNAQKLANYRLVVRPKTLFFQIDQSISRISCDSFGVLRAA